MFNNKIFVSAFLGIGFSGALFAQHQRHPNILYVFPDQFRNVAMEFWSQKGFKEKVNFRGDPVHTPNLNRFARESVVLTSAQSNFPVSSPHRGIFLTGMYPNKSGVCLNCTSNRPVSSLRQDVVTISDVFKQNGYQCAYIGKYHVDYPTKNNPQHPGTYVSSDVPEWDAYTPPERRHGFDYWYSYGTFNKHKSPHYWDNQGQRHEVKEWSPIHEADKVIDYLKNQRNSQKPFFLVWAPNPPHSPYRSTNDCMERDYNLYKNMPLNKLLVRPNVNPELKKKQECAPFYFASVSGVDREFGRILKALKQMGLDKNTIVVFTSDHGETMASHVLDPKNSPYTEAMNVPFLVRYPQALKPGVSPLLLSSVDIMPTILSLAGLKQAIPATAEGTDLSSFLENKKSLDVAPQSVLYIRNQDGTKDADGKVISYFPDARGVKTAQYTLAIIIDRNNKLKQTLFFDDKNDPYQMHNLDITKNKAVFDSLCKQLAVLLKKADDPWYTQHILSTIIPYDDTNK